MIRVRTQDTAERIGRALDLIPPRVRDLLGDLHFFEGDPHFAGLHVHAYGTNYWTGKQVRYRDTAHCSYARYQNLTRAARRTTVCLPQLYCGRRDSYPSVAVILHEIGHALQDRLEHRGEIPHHRERVIYDPSTPGEVYEWISAGILPPVLTMTDYQPHSHVEQFAEGFMIWLHPTLRFGKHGLAAPQLYRTSPDTWRSPWTRSRGDNRFLLAFFNELAGWPADTPPRALRSGSSSHQ